MSHDKITHTGGIDVSGVGGNVQFKAGNDIVSGNKTTTTTTAKGFQHDGDRTAFVTSIDELRSGLRELKTAVDTAPHISQDDKDELVASILKHISDLNVTKQTASVLPSGQGSPDKIASVEKSLDETSGFLNRLGTITDSATTIGEKATELASKIGPVLSKILPILASARQFFGIP